MEDKFTVPGQNALENTANPKSIIAGFWRGLSYLLSWILLLLLIGCAGNIAEPTATAVAPTPTITPTNTPTYTPLFTTADCQFTPLPDETIQCGYLAVPEDRANPQRTIRLHVAIVASHSDTPAPDPVIFLNGGPGVYTLENIGWLFPFTSDILDHRDMIFFDQRGVGYSEPSLDCPEVAEARLVNLANIEQPLDKAAWQAITLEALLACRQRLAAEGVNLSAYHSAASAADVDDLRQALGYESWNLLGVSYGTRLALTIMRDFGHIGTIRSAILDSVYPLHVNDYVDVGVSAQRAFNLLFNRCAADAACNAAYPDLETRFYRLVDALNAAPLILPVSDRVNNAIYQIPFTGDDLIGIAFDMMYDRHQISALPKMLRQLENGSSAILAEYLAETLHTADWFSEGMGMSVQCIEEASFTTKADIQAAAESLPPQLSDKFVADTENVLENCAAWQITPAPALENEPVRSDVAALLLAGDYDPITPPAHAEETAVYLPNSFVFTFIGIAHGVISGHHCGLELALAFLDDPSKPPPADCLPQVPLGFLPP
jgi:pimeloyl-ACP methyl ester carboxylesterase